MNVAATIAREPRRAVSPYARRLAREKDIALLDLPGTGPGGRIVAADVMAYRAPIAANLPDLPTPAIAPVLQIFSFSATVSLTSFYRLVADAARVGLTIEVEDAALRAARTALAATKGAGEPLVALESDGRQILISPASGLSIGAERRLRLAELEDGADASAHPATASLLVLRAARAVPVSMPLRPGRAARLVLVVDAETEAANALLCANADTFSEAQGLGLLDAFACALEQPLALMA